MKPLLDNNRYKISYRVPGYPNTFTERFDTIEEANFRIAQIELDKSKGTLKPPVRDNKKQNSSVTLAVFLDEFVKDYGAKNWGDSYYSCAIHRINDYVKPYLGQYQLRDITTKMLDDFYSELLKKPASARKGFEGRTQTVSISVVEKVRTLLSTAFAQAVRWGYIENNPAYGACVPSSEHRKRDVWTPNQALKALAICNDPNLHMCMLLGLSGSFRIGEILGLQWSDVHISEQTIADGSSHIYIKQELKRCSKSVLKVLDRKSTRLNSSH